MNKNDAELQAMLPVQAAWLGMEEPEAVEIDAAAKDGDSLLVGATEFHVMHTPGHTQGSISLYAADGKQIDRRRHAVPGSIGRTDLPGGDGRQILRSIHENLLPLPEETIVIPGHGANTTIGREKRMNPFLQG